MAATIRYYRGFRPLEVQPSCPVCGGTKVERLVSGIDEAVYGSVCHDAGPFESLLGLGGCYIDRCLQCDTCFTDGR